MQSSLDRLGTGLTGTPWRKSQVLQLRGYNPMHQDVLGLTGWKAAKEKDFGSVVNNKWASRAPSQQRQPTALWAVLGRALPVDQERWSFLSVQHCWDHSWRAVLSSRLLNERDTQTYRNKSSTGPQGQLRDWSILHQRRGWHNWDCSVCRRVQSGRFYQCTNTLMRGNEEEARHSQ